MMRSMYSGISGLRAHQLKMDVIGNNIANVNTVGFKASRVTFKEVLNQTIAPAYESIDGTRGGINPQQVGLGVAVSSVDVLHSTSNGIQRTDNPLDLSIAGDGFFMVRSGEDTFYTRAGIFSFDELGYLVNPSGYIAMDNNGDQIQILDLSEHSNVSIDNGGKITGVDVDGFISELGNVGLAYFKNPNGLLKEGENIYRETPASGAPDIGRPGENTGTVTLSFLNPGTLEMSNVDLAEQFTEMIIAQRGFQANSKIISTSNELLQELVNIIR